MNSIRTLHGAVAFSFSFLAFSSTTAMAEERVCKGTLGAVTVDNLRVPQNATCTLYGTRVKGTIKVESNATLRARKVMVIGNVQAQNARLVLVTEKSRIGGSVQVVKGGGATVADTFVNGNILYDENQAKLSVLRSDVGGNVQVFQNTGGVLIRYNVIDENLQCKANSPAPIGGSNTVGGNKEDQCSRL
jgi:hypothetical protein